MFIDNVYYNEHYNEHSEDVEELKFGPIKKNMSVNICVAVENLNLGPIKTFRIDRRGMSP